MSTQDRRVPTLRAGGRAKPIMPETFEDVQRIATMAVKSELFKKAKQAEADETTVARCCLAIMTGLDVGLSPAQSIQSIAVINGRCLVYGDAVPGILWAHGFDIEQVVATEANDWTATCTITRPNGKQITRSFSKTQALKARLWDGRETVKKKWNDKWEEKPNDSPWFRFPDRMLGWRALGFAKSDGASDVMRGLDIRENDDGRMIDVTPNEDAPSRLDDIPDEPAAVAVVSEAEDRQDNPLVDVPLYMSRLEDALASTQTKEDLDEVWASHQESSDGRLSREHQTQAQALYDKHSNRLAK